MAALSPAVVALDVGGTAIRAALVTAEGRILHATSRPTVRGGRRDPHLAGTVAAAREMVDAAAELGVAVAGIGAGFPEYVAATGRLTSHEVLDWDAQPAALLAPLVPGRPVVVESDVRCAALAEARSGRGRGCGSFLYVSLGTGLSAAFVQDGRPWRGHRGEAIALGTFGVPPSVDAESTAAGIGGRHPGDDGPVPAASGQPRPNDRRRSGKGRHPATLEEHASGAGIAARYTLATGRAVTGARDVVRHAQAGDRTATDVLRTAGQALGTALGWVVALLDPEAVILGGGLGTAGGVLHDALRKDYTAGCLRPPPPALHLAGLGTASGLLGAAILARE